MNDQPFDPLEDKLFEPTYLNIEYFFNRVYEIGAGIPDFFARLFGGNYDAALALLQLILSLLSILFITGIIYALIRIREVKKEEDAQFHFAEPVPERNHVERPRWEMITEKLASDNPSEWRVAIMEADTILDEMVRRMGYQGETLGERLKGVEASDFNTIQDAWEAHKIRNKIAHEGSAFSLSEREARRVIGLYEKVFREFGYL